MLAPQAELVDAVADGVAEVERLDGAVKEVREEAVEGRAGEVSLLLLPLAAAEEDHPELFLADEETVEQLADPSEGEQIISTAGKREVVEEVGHVLLEHFEFEVMGGAAGRGVMVVAVDAMDLVTADAQDGAADGGEGDGGTLEIRGRHGRVTQRQQFSLGNSSTPVRNLWIGRNRRITTGTQSGSRPTNKGGGRRCHV